jgi:imidazoleglycerol-phosphate dehydratase
MPKTRKAIIERKTRETDIRAVIGLDGSGKSKIKTPIGFLNHMLTLFAAHGLFDLKVKGKGDTEIDIHHTNEDIGICLGLAFKEAMADKVGIKRFGFASVPMDEALVEVSLDVSARPYLKVTRLQGYKVTSQEYDYNALKQFLQAFVNNAGITLYVEVIYGEDSHHIIEAVFKALGRALKEAVTPDPRISGILSTKGRL